MIIESIIRRLYNFIRILKLKLELKSRIVIPWRLNIAVCSILKISRKAKKIEFGENFRLDTNAKIQVTDNAELQIGNNFYMNSNCCLVAMGKIQIGDNCQIGPNVLLFDHDHDFRNPDGLIKHNIFKIEEIIIGDNVWIGGNTVILKGSIIGDNSVIAAGSIINGKIPPNTLFVQKRINTLSEYRK